MALFCTMLTRQIRKQLFSCYLIILTEDKTKYDYHKKCKSKGFLMCYIMLIFVF